MSDPRRRRCRRDVVSIVVVIVIVVVVISVAVVVSVVVVFAVVVCRCPRSVVFIRYLSFVELVG